MTALFCYDGTLVRDGPERELLNRGLQYGDGVFETMRAYDGRLFRFREHMQRLRRGLEVLKIRWDGTDENTMEAVSSVLQGNGLNDASVKVVAFRKGGGSPTPEENSMASVIVLARPFEHGRKAAAGQGVSVHVVSIRRNPESPVTFIKSLSYLENILARLEACANDADEALFLNTHSRIAEGATSNIFMVVKGMLCTPPVVAGILKGITRNAVMQIAAEQGVRCRERQCTLKDIMRAEEAFLTSTLMEIMPLVKVNGEQIGNGRPGRLTGDLMQYYAQMVRKELDESYGCPV